MSWALVVFCKLQDSVYLLLLGRKLPLEKVGHKAKVMVDIINSHGHYGPSALLADPRPQSYWGVAPSIKALLMKAVPTPVT